MWVAVFFALLRVVIPFCYSVMEPKHGKVGILKNHCLLLYLLDIIFFGNILILLFLTHPPTRPPLH